MDQIQFEQEQSTHRKAWETLREQVRRDYSGQYVGFAHGRVIATAPTYQRVRETIKALQPPPDYYLIFQAGDEPLFDVIDDFMEIL